MEVNDLTVKFDHKLHCDYNKNYYEDMYELISLSIPAEYVLYNYLDPTWVRLAGNYEP